MIDIGAISTANLRFSTTLEEADPGRLRRRPTTRNGNVATKTGYTYISGTVTDRMTIPMANLELSTTPSATKLTPGDETDPMRLQQQPTTGIAIWTFCLPISQFLAVGRCRNDLANHLLSSTSSKIPNLAWELRRYLFQFQRCNYFRFWWPYRHFRLSVSVLLTCQHYFTCTWSYTPVSLEF